MSQERGCGDATTPSRKVAERRLHGVECQEGFTDAQKIASVRKKSARSQSWGRSSVSKVSQNGATTRLNSSAISSSSAHALARVPLGSKLLRNTRTHE